MIGIVDYGLGNLGSIKNALDSIEINNKIFRDYNEINKFSKIILPGVGSFAHAINNLHKYNLFESIKEFSQTKPIMGICLGMQLLLSTGYESGKSIGLSLIKGEVKKIIINKNLKLPHVGWNNLDLKFNHRIFDNVNLNADFYFIHSYECFIENEENILSVTSYGKNIVSSIFKDNIIGFQYHPEKSQSQGLKIFKNFNKI